ncbi:MAG TPA: hypothetical protein VJ044_06985 [Candidatus Hodarchaeales archaeon]|nr:hypothetical protein [Candidatus Hodarchaeales archaeon]
MSNFNLIFPHYSKGPLGPPPTTRSKIAKKVREKRIRLLLSQRQAAEVVSKFIQISYDAWRAVERGEIPARKTRIKKAINHFLATRYYTERKDNGTLFVSGE